jgi:hypothetical protein
LKIILPTPVTLDDVDQISDTEENELAITKEQPVIQELSSRALGKRRRSVAFESEDEVTLPPLLQSALQEEEEENQLRDSQLRLSGRKCSRNDDDQYVYY